MTKEILFWLLPSALTISIYIPAYAEPPSQQPRCASILSQLASRLSSESLDEAVEASDKILEYLATKKITDWQEFSIITSEAIKVLAANRGMAQNEHPVGEILKAIDRAEIDSLPIVIQKFWETRDSDEREKLLGSLFLAAVTNSISEEAQSAIFKAIDDPDEKIQDRAVAGIWSIYAKFQRFLKEDPEQVPFNSSVERIETEIFPKVVEARVNRILQHADLMFGVKRAQQLKTILNTGEGLLSSLEAEALFEAILQQRNIPLKPEDWFRQSFGSTYRHYSMGEIGFISKWYYQEGQSDLTFSPELFFALQSSDPRANELARFWARCFVDYYIDYKGFSNSEHVMSEEVFKLFRQNLLKKQQQKRERNVSQESAQRRVQIEKMIVLAVDNNAEQLIPLIKDFLRTSRVKFLDIKDSRGTTLDNIATSAGNHILADKLRLEFLERQN
jgi:hypothetical protein